MNRDSVSRKVGVSSCRSVPGSLLRDEGCDLDPKCPLVLRDICLSQMCGACALPIVFRLREPRCELNLLASETLKTKECPVPQARTHLKSCNSQSPPSFTFLLGVTASLSQPHSETSTIIQTPSVQAFLFTHGGWAEGLFSEVHQ